MGESLVLLERLFRTGGNPAESVPEKRHVHEP
jgi:hypothetical protein